MGRSGRECYQNIIKLSSDEFFYMILVDGIFLVELLMRNYFADDDIFLKLWMRADIFHDIMLLENQLPFFILERLYHTIEISVVGKEKPPFYDLAYNYFNYAVNLRTCSESQLIDEGSKIKHMVDLLYSFYWPPENLIAWGLYGEDVRDFEFTRTAAELHAAGVKFKVKEDCGYPVAIEFAYGFLNIPCLTVNEWTEPLFHNLIAYEQCHQYDRMVSSYVMLMKSLINRPKDVDVLIDCGIIDNSLGSSEDVCILFNSLHNFKAAMNGRQFYYTKLCKDLNAYSRTRWNQWKAKWHRSKQILKRDYLSNPWTTLSVIAAVLLLGLSVIQAVCSILALQ